MCLQNCEKSLHQTLLAISNQIIIVLSPVDCCVANFAQYLQESMKWVGATPISGTVLQMQ